MIPKILLALFIIAHGLVYLLYFVKGPEQNWPFTFDKGPLSSVRGLRLFAKLVVIVVVWGFVIGGMALLVAPAQTIIWQVSLVIAIALSLVVQLAYWQNQLFLGLLINFFLLYIVFFTHWLK